MIWLRSPTKVFSKSCCIVIARSIGSLIELWSAPAERSADGAAALVIAGEEFVESKNLEPIGRIISWAYAGVEPELMGIGPVPATRKALEKAGLKLSDMDLVEVNEAFAAQYLAVEQELGLDREITNVNGGAIALGHPLGATGTRLVLTLLHELRRRGGQGIAIICERV
jgi:acetyl-CoA acetyltransferase